MKRSSSHIQTGRLWLRQIDETDAEYIVKTRSDESVYQYFFDPKKLSLEEHMEWYMNMYISSDDRIDWVAIDDEDGTFIGVYGIKGMDSNEIEVSYITSSEKAHKGYATEAVNAIIGWCRAHFDVNAFFVRIHKDNEGSIRFARSIGFKEIEREGSFLRMILEDLNVSSE